MAVDFAIAVLHEFEDVHLVAVRSLPWVFPDKDVATSVVVGVAVPAYPFIRATACAFFEEGLDFGFTTQSTVFALQDDRHQRLFKFSVIVVEGDKGIRVAVFGRLMPGVVEVFCGIHRGFDTPLSLRKAQVHALVMGLWAGGIKTGGSRPPVLCRLFRDGSDIVMEAHGLFEFGGQAVRDRAMAGGSFDGAADVGVQHPAEMEVDDDFADA